MQERCLLGHCLNNETPYEGVTEVFEKEYTYKDNKYMGKQTVVTLLTSVNLSQVKV